MAQTRVLEPLSKHSKRPKRFLSPLFSSCFGTSYSAVSAIMLKRRVPSLSCAICEIRKEKRFCPAVHGRICPQCCGEQREVTLDCPSDCPYLQQAREHEKPRSADEIDSAERGFSCSRACCR